MATLLVAMAGRMGWVSLSPVAEAVALLLLFFALTLAVITALVAILLKAVGGILRPRNARAAP